MIKNPIDMGQVFRRSLCLSDSRDYGVSSCNTALSKVKRSLSENYSNTTLKNDVKNLILEAANKKAANKYAESIIEIFSELYKRGKYDILDNTFPMFLNSIVPYCENVGALSTMGIQHDIGNVNIDKLALVESQYKLCDRILDNHNKISKRFNISEGINSTYTPSDVARYVCTMVDTYTMKPHIKMEICFEEAKYLIDRYNIPFDESQESIMVETITNYFLNYYPKMADKFRCIIQESKLLSESADSNIKFLTSPQIYTTALLEGYTMNSIMDSINRYKLSPVKTIIEFKKCITEIAQSPLSSIASNSKAIFDFIREYCIYYSSFNEQSEYSYIFSRPLNYSPSKADINLVTSLIEAELTNVSSIIRKNASNEIVVNRFNHYIDSLNSILNEYADYISTLNNPNSVKIESAIVLESDKKEIVMNNLLNDSIQIDKFIDSIIEKKKGIKKTKVKDNPSSETLESYVTSDNTISYTFSMYEVDESVNRKDLISVLESIINGTNNILHDKTTYVYYTLRESELRFNIATKASVIIPSIIKESQSTDSFTDMEKYYICNLLETADKLEILSKIDTNRLIKKAILEAGSMSPTQVQYLINTWSNGTLIDRESMSRFVESYIKECNKRDNYIDAYNIKSLFESTKEPSKYNLDIMIEATNEMQQIITEKFDINNLKLALVGFGKKIKDLSAKEKEFSRQLDATFNHYIRSIQNARETARRDAVIRGTVIPSLSKIVKIGIAIAGASVAGGVTGLINPATVLICAAIGGFVNLGLEKKATNKERQIYIDEIDVELQVVDREIKRCEDKNSSSKKYRQLLMYQKELQRGKQKLVYGLAQNGGHYISSTSGLKGGD